MALPERLTERIALALKRVILEHAASAPDREIRGAAPGGDVTFAVDAAAEQALAALVEREGLRVAVYSEGRGLVRYGGGEPEGILVVDPVDGTRPFNAGLPLTMVSVALARPGERPVFEDVEEACLVDVGRDRVLYARGEAPPEIRVDGANRSPRPYAHRGLDALSWAFEIAGRPSAQVVAVLGELLDRSGLRGGCFSFASATYAITQVVTGELGAFVDVGGWLLDAMLVDEEAAVGMYPYDIAAAWRIATNAGCNVTDLYGKPLVDVVLTEASPDTLLSCVVTGHLELHRELLAHLKERAEAVLGVG
jgi:myo-inositol-1(or 4)-monophosphatase